MSNGLYDKYLVVNLDTGEEVRGVFTLKPSTDPAAISQNFFRVINELRFPQKNLQLILGLHNVQTISNWKTKKEEDSVFSTTVWMEKAYQKI